jgi:hypothetical protein
MQGMHNTLLTAAHLFVMKEFNKANSVCERALNGIEEDSTMEAQLREQALLLHLRIAVELGTSDQVWEYMIMRYGSVSVLTPNVLIAG